MSHGGGLTGEDAIIEENESNYVKARDIDLFGEVGSIEFGDATRGWPGYIVQRRQLWCNHQSG